MINHNAILSECTFKTSRSSGAGGQHVNKVETRVTIIFNLKKSKVLNDSQKELIKNKLSNIITKSCVLQLSSQRFKSQFKNKVDVEKK
jgi:ribosome-associated protein